MDPDGIMRLVFPEMLVYVADMPECKLVAGCYDSAKAEYPCEQCWCPRVDLGNVGITHTHALRYEAEQLEKYEAIMAETNPAARKKMCEQLSQHPVKSGLWGFAGASSHRAFTGNDSLHNEVCIDFAYSDEQSASL